MSTDTDVCNIALIAMGQTDLLVTLDSTTKAGRIFSALFDSVRRAALEARPWSFARKRIRVAAATTDPVFGTGKYFPKPQDFVRFLLDRDDADLCYRIEGDNILSPDGAPLDFTYIFDQKNLATWNPQAVLLFGAGLAAHSAYALTGDKGVRDDMEAIYARRLSQASFVDSFNESAQELQADIWLHAHQAATY